MHELSIADSLMEQVRRHTPGGKRLQTVRLRIGAKQGIDPESLKMAWEVTVARTALAGAKLEVEYLPWQLTCPQCQRKWESPEVFVECQCGCATPLAEGSGELTLLSLDVE